MADEIRRFQATIPASTPITAPALFSMAMDPRTVRYIDWIVPPGPMGLVGWRLTMGGVPVIPLHSTDYVIEDNNSGRFDMDGFPDSGAWQLQGYNTGVFPHSIFIVFHVDYIRQKTPIKPIIHPFSLAPVPDLSQAGPPVRRTS